ncbi:chromate efflux transporter [Sandarakinorhabdus sp. DWP1-3-1]|uniref:chromate efflux transporter n=1 Tax=Sandarakinorhabdus sp. DWP1-3-1 TaxID=2804627 RepID=UPI003CF08627
MIGPVFWTFLRLGMTSFGGPLAHIGFFRREIVERRRWLDTDDFTELLAICQFLPGPASSQLGFAIGLRHAGLAGGIAAWVGFTLPSALLMYAAACGLATLAGPVGSGIIHGLKLAAVAIVAQAVFDMARTQASDAVRLGLAVLAAIIVALLGGGSGQLLAIVVGALLGRWLCNAPGHFATAPAAGVSRRVGVAALALLMLLLVGGPILAAAGWRWAGLFDAFYRSGVLVFGGGHVVLPMLEARVVPSFVSEEAFLAGYAIAQALPGPLFGFATYLGALATPGPGGAILATVAIFLPGLLLVLGTVPHWDRLRGRAGVRAAIRGANAAVVGVLGWALFTPVATNALVGIVEVIVAALALLALVRYRLPPLVVVMGCAVAGVAITLLP